MEHDALAAHTRDELGITDTSTANPIQAAIFSAVSFSLGSALPLAVAWFTPHTTVIWTTAASCLIFLMVLGAVAARAGGASLIKGAVRVLFWSSAAMLATFGVGKLFGANV